MSDSFERLLSLPDQIRKDVFERTADRLDAEPGNIEKDFWVCFVLDVLYNRLPEEHLPLLFKGGTALSKAFSLINRFSEDIDIVVDRNGLGFGTDQDPFSSGLSGKERGRRFEKLKGACGAYVCGKLASSLTTFLGEWCNILPDEYDEQTLLIKYPTFYPNEGSGYVLPYVKLEGGARSAVAPSTIASATPYISEEFLEGWSFKVENLHVIEPTRTYLDKLLILHGAHCRYRDEKRLPPEGHRISRHYYDAATILPVTTAAFTLRTVGSGAIVARAKTAEERNIKNVSKRLKQRCTMIIQSYYN